MPAATLLLVGALCTASDCTYLDASSKYELKTPDECWEAAEAMNVLNKFAGQQVRYACLDKIELDRLRKL
ncbi:hypothetical protein D9M71_675610 [compost metagenome]